MKKISLLILFCMTFVCTYAQDIDLPDPEVEGGMALNDALNRRKSAREFSDKSLDLQQISNLLWAANGVNRTDGRRTAPSARNMQEIDIYVFTPDGVYLYLPKENRLQLLLSEDHRKLAVKQDFATKAPLILVYVANYDKMNKNGMDLEAREFYGATDCGFVSQNVYLHCASQGYNTVVLGMIFRQELQKLLRFNGKAILGQPVGFPL